MTLLMESLKIRPGMSLLVVQDYTLKGFNGYSVTALYLKESPPYKVLTTIMESYCPYSFAQPLLLSFL